MPLGSAVKSTIDIDYTRAQGVNSSGRITFQPPRIRIGTTMISTHKVMVDIENGVGSVELARLPAGTYRVREEIDGRPPYEYSFALPLSAPSTIQYEEIAAVDPIPEIFTSVKTINGVPPNPVTGDIEIAEGGGPSTLNGLSDVTIASPANGDVLAYDATDSQWENRILSASDVGASPTGHTHSSSQISDFSSAVDARVQLIVDAAPSALDTLNELAAALGDDPDFAGTITLLLAGKQPLSAALTEIAGLSPLSNAILQYNAGVWSARTTSQVKTSLALTKADVGLGSVTNTSDADKPVSTAQQAALNAKANLTEVILKALADAKGDLFLGSGDNAIGRLAVGSDGQILYADAAQTMGVRWDDPPVGGGGGGIQAFASSGRQTIAFGPCNTSGTWTLCPTEYRVTVPAAVGDILHWTPRLIAGISGGDAEIDVASVVSGSAARFYSSGTTVQSPNGHGGLYLGGNYVNGLNAIDWVVTADDISAGQVTLALMYRAGASGTQIGSAVYPGQIDVINHGQES